MTPELLQAAKSATMRSLNLEEWLLQVHLTNYETFTIARHHRIVITTIYYCVMYTVLMNCTNGPDRYSA